jgi:hypothetical protein
MLRFTGKEASDAISDLRPPYFPFRFQPTCLFYTHSVKSTDLFVAIRSKMCFPCSAYEDVYFEPRPKPPKVNKHPHAGTIYAAYHAPRPMLPLPRPIFPVLLPVDNFGRPIAAPVSNYLVFSRSAFLPNSQPVLTTSLSSLHTEIRLGRLERSIHFFL